MTVLPLRLRRAFSCADAFKTAVLQRAPFTSLARELDLVEERSSKVFRLRKSNHPAGRVEASHKWDRVARQLAPEPALP